MSSDEYADRRERRPKRRYDKASTSIQHRDPWPRNDKTPIDTFEEFADPKKAGDFQRVVVDALRAIWARVSCTSRRTIRAHSPAAAGPSRQRRDPSSGSNDGSSEATD
ncbi:hypothetical protein F2Q70_00022585 [Brassica cretica]|uniref:Uncharacterized protein n=1 Tax=Brassica cretica TaxID=69181 RepID=A0A8S9GEQ0_BRACR|nr:hypothetical protein F2Q70_00022585 [Brassica cretica]